MCRCGEKFGIFNGIEIHWSVVYLSASKCSHHSRKPAFVSGVRLHGCCNAPAGSPPCATSNNHVTLQHRPRALAKTSSRRHVRKDLQHSVFSLDCEMCYTTEGLEVVRVCVVNIDGLPVYDGYVKPKGKILDYNTLYRGVGKKPPAKRDHHVGRCEDNIERIYSGRFHLGRTRTE
ncbi:hypothetical protein AVEN_146341-1 [Araneus ventricosus]|uniref:Exonuclease domain-containing protein n=1 Tax=Araneus ventricosus TaxID=182803 RepID=A0A4Y2V755_ARAVE|nr:hypothetical protein AVEN_146341-1 [Araneus ventricosus]